MSNILAALWMRIDVFKGKCVYDIVAEAFNLDATESSRIAD
jgi:hypothetical protein